jgi:hypothetical protein
LPYLKIYGNIKIVYLIKDIYTGDMRSIKVDSGNSCIDYLQTILWLHRKKTIILTDNPKHNYNDDGIIFIYWITNVVWSMHEDNYSE